jgi:TRAP-type C4-dicarboxylate transport system permease small subunit
VQADLSNVMTRLAALIAAIGLFALTMLAIVTMLDIAGRELFRIPINGFSDIADLIVVFAAASCFPISLIERHHVSVRFLGKLGWRVREALDLLGHALMLGVFVLMAWQVAVYALEVYNNGQTTWLIRIPVWPVWFATAFMIAVCVPTQALIVVEQVRRAFSPVPLPEFHEDAPELQDGPAGSSL